MSTVDSMLEAELDRWRMARERQSLIEGRWGAPPPVPVVGEWRAIFDPTGRYALLVGYRAVHLLDLSTARSTLLLREARGGRDGAFDPTGRRAVVADGYGERLHVIEFDDAPRVETHRWACPRPLRGELAVALDAAGLVAVVGRDLDEAPLSVRWLDSASGATLYAREISPDQLGTTGPLGGLRATAEGLHIWLDDPEARAIEIGPDPGTDVARPQPALSGGACGPWTLTGAGKRWQLCRADGPPIGIRRPRERVVIGDGPATERVAVAVDGRVAVYATATGAPVGGPVEPPGRRRFARVGSMLVADDRLWVHGEGPTSVFGADRCGLLAAYQLDGDTWRETGVVLLADRVMAARRQRQGGAERMSNVYVRGVQLTVAQLEAKGIRFVGGDAEGEAAQAQFACPRDDAYGRELPFVRTAAGFFGRLDDDRPLGPALVAPFERPAAARERLLGHVAEIDAATRAALDDWRERLEFWRADPAWAQPDALRRLMDASAGLGDLLPEIVHRAPRGKGGASPKTSGLCRVAERMQRKSTTDRHGAAFREMLARERRARRPVLVRERLEQACPNVPPAVVEAAVHALDGPVEAVADAAGRGATTLSLRDVSAGAALAGLLAAASDDLALERLELPGCALGDDGVVRLAGARWPALRHLDLSRTGLTDRGALALATSTGLPGLETWASGGTAVTHRGRALLRGSPTLPALRETLSPLAAWAGLLDAHEDATPALATALDALWAETIDAGHVIELTDAPELSDTAARVRWSAACRTLAIEGIAISSTGLQALIDAERTVGLDRLTLRRCALGDDASEALMALMARLGEEAALDLSHNRLGQPFALQLAADDARPGAGRCALELTGNPIDPAGWGVLRAVLGQRLAGAPGAAATQLAAAAVALQRVDLDDRAGWLGRAFAAAPQATADILAALEARADSALLRALLASPAIGEPTEPRAWPALTAHALGLASTGRVEWWLGRVQCVVEDGGLRLRPIGGPPDDVLRIEAEPDGSRLRKLWSGQDVLTGDADFDRVALIAGDPGLALALLDPEARAAVARGLPTGLVLHSGALHLPRTPDVAGVVALAELAARLTVPDGPLVDIQARRLATETVPETARLLAEALTAPAVVISLAQLDAAAETTAESARALIGAALAERLDAAAIETLGPAGLAAALEAAPGDLIQPMIGRLAAIGDERAVAPLTRLASAFFGSGAVKRAARAAVEVIVERQGGLRAGGLSVLPTGPTGGLSAPQGEG